ncbi:uncharacterized protein METZ01_LOCUS298494, partial [marine metagenome]
VFSDRTIPVFLHKECGDPAYLRRQSRHPVNFQMKTTPKKGKYTHLWALLLLSTLSIPALAPGKMAPPPANATSNSTVLAGVVTEVTKRSTTDA